MTTNAAVEAKIARELSGLLRELGLVPAGYEVHVSFHRGNRKKRKDATFDANWDPDADSVRVTFSPMEEASDDVERATPSKHDVVEDRLAGVVRALMRAEGRPGYEFVSLKWFRDSALAREGFPWAEDL